MSEDKNGTYENLVCYICTIQQTQDCLCNVQSSVAPGKVVKGEQTGIHFESLWLITLGDPVRRQCEEWTKVLVCPDISRERNFAFGFLL